MDLSRDFEGLEWQRRSFFLNLCEMNLCNHDLWVWNEVFLFRLDGVRIESEVENENETDQPEYLG